MSKIKSRHVSVLQLLNMSRSECARTRGISLKMRVLDVFVSAEIEQIARLLSSLQEVDMGLYSCSVSAWSVNNQGNFVKISEQQSLPLTVRWAPKRKAICVSAPFRPLSS